MPRIHVIGAPGSGKTTYANKLATKLNLPLCHLDEIYHDNSSAIPRKRSESERTAMAHEFAAGKNCSKRNDPHDDKIAYSPGNALLHYKNLYSGNNGKNENGKQMI